MNDKKTELSNNVLNLVLKECPIEIMLTGNIDDADEYVDIVTDSLSSVMGRIAAAYVCRMFLINPEMTENDVMKFEDDLHSRLKSHMNFEADELNKKIDEEKKRIDA